MNARPRIVAIGGGHGLYATLTALRDLAADVTAIVTVADDGGSSGRLRTEMGIVPPGDLRMALSALCPSDEYGRTWHDILQWRFKTDGPLNGHALGNLLIAALWDRQGNVVEGLDHACQLLHTRGRVLPLSTEPLEVTASVRHHGELRRVHGQAAVAVAEGVIEELQLHPPRPQVPTETIDAIDSADLVVLGPGSWYTSVLTHFLVAPVAEALSRASARSAVILNVGYDDAETAGTGRADDVLALQRLAPGFRPAMVLVDHDHEHDPGLADAVAAWGAQLIAAQVRDRGTPVTHDVELLREQLAALVGGVGPQVPSAARRMG